MFITFEGTEGCGKSTQAKLLASFLKKQGYKVLSTVEPGGTELGKRIRKVLLHADFDIHPETETLLYMASRAQLVREVILPALRAKKIVISDRWLDATLAYQGYGLGVDLDWIRRMGKVATRGLKPNLTLFLDLHVKTGLKRVAARSGLDRIERRRIEFHERVRRGYQKIARQEKRFHRIPVTTLADTQSAVRKAVLHVL